MTEPEASVRDAVVREAIAGMATAGTPDAVADRLAPVVASLFGSDAAVVYRYDGAEDAFTSVARTEAAEPAPSPVTPDDGARWGAFAGDSPAVVSAGEARSLVLPVPDVGALRIAGVESTAIAGSDLELAGLVAPAAVGAAVRERRLESRREAVTDLRQENEQLRDFADIVSHDLRNPLAVARGNLQLAFETGEDEFVRKVEKAHDRIDGIIEHTLALAREGEQVGNTVPTDVETVARRAWSVVDTTDATLDVPESPTIDADPERLQQCFENLFRNAVEHGSTSPGSQARQDAVEHGSTSPRSTTSPEDAAGTSSDEPSVAAERSSSSPGSQTRQDTDAPEDAVEHGSTSPPSQAQQDAIEHGSDSGGSAGDGTLHDGTSDSPDAAHTVTVRVGATPDGFYVEDDGPGIPPEDRDRVFERGYSGSDGGTGLGLGVVDEIVAAHSWAIEVGESETGGARFEIRTEGDGTR